MSQPTPLPLSAVCRTETLCPSEGLTLTSRLTRGGGRRSVEVRAEDGHGIRRDAVGGFPSDGAAERFFLLVLRGAVTPYTLVEIYDGFMEKDLT